MYTGIGPYVLRLIVYAGNQGTSAQVSNSRRLFGQEGPVRNISRTSNRKPDVKQMLVQFLASVADDGTTTN